MKKRCRRCKKRFVCRKWNHVFCGSKSKKTGCSWLNSAQIRNKRRWQNESYRIYQRRYGRNWRKQQRQLHTDYAKRQRQLKRVYYRTERGKKIKNEWRRENIGKVLFWNKKRVLKKKQVTGSHTWKEWEKLKVQYKYRCALCGILGNPSHSLWTTPEKPLQNNDKMGTWLETACQKKRSKNA